MDDGETPINRHVTTQFQLVITPSAQLESAVECHPT
jgi:hypothetical protein